MNKERKSTCTNTCLTVSDPDETDDEHGTEHIIGKEKKGKKKKRKENRKGKKRTGLNEEPKQITPQRNGHTRRKNKKVTNRLKLWYNNVNGINSKRDSLEQYLLIDQPHIIAITETKTPKPPIINGYKWISGKKPNKAGGIAIGARRDIADNTQEIDMIKEGNMEITWIKLKTQPNPIYIGLYYGKQEKESKEAVENEYSIISTHILELKKTGNIILMGDFNAKLDIIRDNTQIQTQSRNGQAMQRMLHITQMYPISTQPTKGTWTRVNRHNEQERSIIDYIIVDKELKDNFPTVEIDEKGERRPTGKNETDHNTITTHLNTNLKKTKKIIEKWKITEETKWEKYNENLQNPPTPETYDEMEQKITQALKNTIGTKKININKKPRLDEEAKSIKKEMKEKKRKYNQACREKDPDIEQIYENYIHDRKKLQKEIEKKQAERTKKIANQLIKEGGVKSKQFWNLRNKLSQQEKKEYDLITEQDEKVNDPSRAKEEIAKYYENLYQAREGKPEFEPQTQEIEQRYSNIQQKMKSKAPCQKITIKELNTAIKKLKRKKATGPDGIPNEAIKEMSETNKENLCNILNNITQEEKIPKQWLNSNIIRIYKGKGKKGKCSSERGITLSSNIGKLYERIFNNRIEPVLNITDEQAGGRKNRSTTDHIALIASIINHYKKKKKPTYITFLDVTKAYDKAWIKAIMYVLEKEGIQQKEWQIIDLLNTGLTATILTKYGPTRQIEIKDSIRQGGVLSVIQYATLMDEISKETKKTKIGIKIPGTTEYLNTLLWMDDVALITNNRDDMQKLLDITYTTASKYHIAFGKEKSKMLKIGNKNNQEITTLTLGDMQIEQTDKYKYLGLTINNKNNLADQMKDIKTKTEGAYQTVMSLLHNKEFNNIEMSTIWKLVETCVTPNITYACEVWTPNRQEINTLNGILDNILKRILMVPQGTPREVLYIETNLLDVERIIDKKRLNMLYRINKTKIKLNEYLIQKKQETEWMKETEKTIKKYKIDKKKFLEMKPKNAKKYIRKEIQKSFREEMFLNKQNKSKVEYLKKGYLANEKATYTNQLNRMNTSTIFKARCRMLDIKDNYKNKYNNMTCRLCKEKYESQEHVLKDCPITKKNDLTIDLDLLHTRSRTIMSKIAQKIREIEKLLKQ